MKYKRILLKLSGEALSGNKGYGIDPKILMQYSGEIKRVMDAGTQVAIVIGGGNIFRGYRCSRSRHRPGTGRLHGYAGNRN